MPKQLPSIVRFYGLLLVVFIGVFIWSMFDFHNRMPVLMAVQFLVLLVRVFVKARRQTTGTEAQ
jgi:hypothetical protein